MFYKSEFLETSLQFSFKMSMSDDINLLLIFLHPLKHLCPKSLFFFFFSPFSSTGLVRLYITGLPVRSCPDHWATFCRGVPNVHFSLGSSRI